MGRTELTSLPPEWPPAEVWDEVDRAACAWRELRAQGREVHFARAADGRVGISLRELGGNVLRELSPADTLALASAA
jgi:hypothetical protein